MCEREREREETQGERQGTGRGERSQRSQAPLPVPTPVPQLSWLCSHSTSCPVPSVLNFVHSRVCSLFLSVGSSDQPSTCLRFNCNLVLTVSWDPNPPPTQVEGEHTGTQSPPQGPHLSAPEICTAWKRGTQARKPATLSQPSGNVTRRLSSTRRLGFTNTRRGKGSI